MKHLEKWMSNEDKVDTSSKEEVKVAMRECSNWASQSKGKGKAQCFCDVHTIYESLKEVDIEIIYSWILMEWVKQVVGLREWGCH